MKDILLIFYVLFSVIYMAPFIIFAFPAFLIAVWKHNCRACQEHYLNNNFFGKPYTWVFKNIHVVILKKYFKI